MRLQISYIRVSLLSFTNKLVSESKPLFQHIFYLFNLGIGLDPNLRLDDTVNYLKLNRIKNIHSIFIFEKSQTSNLLDYNFNKRDKYHSPFLSYLTSEEEIQIYLSMFVSINFLSDCLSILSTVSVFSIYFSIYLLFICFFISSCLLCLSTLLSFVSSPCTSPPSPLYLSLSSGQTLIKVY